MPQLATICYIDNGKELLMLHRNKKPNDVHEGKWIGVGGKLERGETPQECAAREILEEMHLAAPQRRSARAQLTPEEAHVYQVLSFDHALTMDEIIDSLPVSTTTSLPLLLLQMQLKGVIIENEMHAYRRAERN